MRLVIPRELKGIEVANLLYLEKLVSLSIFFIFYVFTSFFPLCYKILFPVWNC